MMHGVRKDIEGLRALAVLAVLLNHTRASMLAGGFAGVDIFFVISGYLIGKHLLAEIGQDRLSLLRFYGRRARRLFPALLVMLLAVWAIGWAILSGAEFTDLGKHVAAAALFSNNVLLWSQSGYFDAPSSVKPLLHLWSLGVEEQFYLLVPCLLLLGSSRGRPALRWALRAGSVSLLFTLTCPVPRFYLLDTRFWELGVGVGIGALSLYQAALRAREPALGDARRRECVLFALALMFAAGLDLISKAHPWQAGSLVACSGASVAFVAAVGALLLTQGYRDQTLWHRLMAFCGRHDRGLRNLAGFAGVASIACSLIGAGAADWPGPATVLPVAGAGLVILAGPAAATNRVLAMRPWVFIGGISYPLYLWHWPALVYWRLCGFETGGTAGFVPVAAAFGLAWLTQECVENPLRFGTLARWRAGRPRLGVLVAGLALVGLVGASTVLTQGYPVRFGPGLRAMAAWSMPAGLADWRMDRCFFRPGASDAFATECTPPAHAGEQRVLLWGDSHAAHLYAGLASLPVSRNLVLVQWTSAGCAPLRTAVAGEFRACDQRRAQALRDMRQLAPDTVLISAAWQMYRDKGTPEAALLAALDDDVRWLRDCGVQRIVVFGPGPSWTRPVSSSLLMQMLRKRLDAVPERLDEEANGVRRLDAAIAARAAAAQVQYVSVLERFCDPRGCRVLGDPRAPWPDLLFLDQEHLTPSGSRFLMQAVAPQLFETGERRVEAAAAAESSVRRYNGGTEAR